MLVLRLIAVGSLLAASAFFGSGILARGLRTRQMPELCLGTALLGMGVLAVPLQAVAVLGLRDLPELGGILLGAGLFFGNLGALAAAGFVWKVFRPGSSWAREMVAGFGILLATSWLGQAMVVGFATSQLTSLASATGFALRASVLLWAALEAWRYWAQLRRRELLGLSDPLVTTRFYWAAVGFSAAVVSLSLPVVAFLAGLDLARSVALTGASAGFSLTVACSIWFACAPPGVLRRRAQFPQRA